jgi:hypothetical protein
MTIESLAGGQYRINSFFDVFTEMSVDAGQTWFPMEAPEPGAAVLMVLAAVGAIQCRNRRT